jgi:hypothetical protein
VSWQEEHFVVYVHDVYTDRKHGHGRIIEFYSEDGGMRVVPLDKISMTKAQAKSIAKSSNNRKDEDG